MNVFLVGRKERGKREGKNMKKRKEKEREGRVQLSAPESCDTQPALSDRLAPFLWQATMTQMRLPQPSQKGLSSLGTEDPTWREKEVKRMCLLPGKNRTDGVPMSNMASQNVLEFKIAFYTKQ